MEAGSQRVLVLEKAWQILAAFTVEQPEHDLRALRDRTGLPPTTCTRIVANLQAAGLLSERDGRYRIGPTAVRLATVAFADLDVLDVIRPHLRDLRDETSETAGFFVREGGDRVCVAFAETHRPIGRRLTLGHTLPLNVGSPGKVLLAFDPAAPDALSAGPLPAYTERTIDDRGALERELERIRRDGYAISRGEWSLEVIGIAAPIFGGEGETVGAVAVSAPVTRLGRERIPQVRDAVLATAGRVSAALGLRARG